ncbi:hypothetical protein MTR67_017809 [Solanum verrucosum]|uniref:Uncharacterized protein n=1 Tax=Solanum verrucosum TaxID=315347 RepID=A0AAF0QR15_SOLVR|nr:hypothetical protein MTR67_017809 [Solanum verrucosum]
MGGGVGINLVCSRIGKVANNLELAVEFAVVYLMIHVSMLKKCVGDPSLIVPLETVGVIYSLSFEEVQVFILRLVARQVSAFQSIVGESSSFGDFMD